MLVEFLLRQRLKTQAGWSPDFVAYVLCDLGQETNLSELQFLYEMG